MTKEEMEMYDFVVENGIATANELNLAFNLVDGNWKETINSVLYIRTGYRTFEQLLRELYGEDEEEPEIVAIYILA